MTHPIHTDPLAVSAKPGTESGMSLIEVVFAGAILLVVAAGLLPLFIRSGFNNISGADATQASQHAKSELDDLLIEPIDDPRFDLANALPEHTVQASTVGVGGDEMLRTDLFWDEAARASNPHHVRVGDGGWITDPEAGQGLVFWRRRSVIRQYTYADISDGVIDATDPTQLATLGHAQLFDRPLRQIADSSFGHFREQDVQMESQRAGGDDLGAGSLRTRLVRTF
ncbi:MAG: hypothetical protein AAF657_28570, partial [Acidobacteriota bacterium]